MEIKPAAYWRLPLLAAALTALFWGAWWLVAGSVPDITAVTLWDEAAVDLPFAVSRWTDVPSAYLFTLAALAAVRFCQNAYDETSAVLGLFLGLFLGLVLGLGAGLGVVMSVGLGVGLTFTMGGNLDYGLGVGLGAGLGVGLVYGLVLGLAYGLISILVVGLAYGLIHGLAYSLVHGLAYGLKALRACRPRDIGRWLLGG